jgi:hypothetical protein
MADYYDKEGVIRRGWSKVWREDDPERFADRVESYRDGGLLVWILFKLGALMLFCAGLGTFLEQFSK